MRYTYQVGDHTHTVRLERAPDGIYVASVDGREVALSVRALNDGGWLLTLAGQQFVAYGASDGSTRYVHVGGQQYTLTVPDSSTKRRRASASGGDLTAQMPGQVVDVLVREGDMVQAGQTLLILEAMKMEIRVTAPSDGRVRRLPVEKGAVVERGQPLIELEPANSP